MLSDKEIRDNVRANLIRLRKASGHSQADVGRYVGKSENAVGSWEQGLSLPDLVTLVKLSKYYGVSIDDIYGGIDL